MMKYNKLHCIAKSAAIMLAAAMLGFAGCTTSDDTLGNDFLPENQEMRAGTLRIAKAKQFFETRLYQTDSVKTSNLGYVYFGTAHNDTTGLVNAGFISQFLSYYRIESGYFGYRPIFDSVQILLSVKTFGRDTLTTQTFDVYEVTSSDYLTEGDSIFYINFAPEKYISTEPLFSFDFPNGTTIGPATKTVTMTPSKKGREFVNRLMISDGTKPYQEGVDYSIYADDTEFLKYFKGLCIKPRNPESMGSGKGSVFGTELAASGFMIYCRNRVESDPMLINDTVKAAYFFYHKEFTTGNQSVNTIRHDYTNSQITIADAVESNTNRPLSPNIIVSGMGGVISELTFTQEFFTAIEEEITKANAEHKTNYSTLAMNRALLTIYFTGSDYDWQKIVQGEVTPLMSAALPRLGSYTNYNSLTNISDYDYNAEKNLGYAISYGGYINRSQACYTLDISGFLQGVWNRYLEAKSTAVDGKADLSKIKKLYLGPDAYNLFTTNFAKVQGMDLDNNTAPVKIDLTYTLIK